MTDENHDYRCPSCANDLTMCDKVPGLPFKCSVCGTEITAPAKVVTSTQIRERSGSGLMMIVGIVFNAAYILFMFIGLSMKASEGTTYGLGEKFFIVVYIAVAVLNIVCLIRPSISLRRTQFTLNVIFFICIGLLVAIFNPSAEFRVGGVMQLVVGIMSIIAIQVSDKVSWISLILERKRLEERQKISKLEESLRKPPAE